MKVETRSERSNRYESQSTHCFTTPFDLNFFAKQSFQAANCSRGFQITLFGKRFSFTGEFDNLSLKKHRWQLPDSKVKNSTSEDEIFFFSFH